MSQKETIISPISGDLLFLGTATYKIDGDFYFSYSSQLGDEKILVKAEKGVIPTGKSNETKTLSELFDKAVNEALDNDDFDDFNEDDYWPDEDDEEYYDEDND